MAYSEYQKAIFRDVLNGSGNTAVIARAGSGKTFSILESFKFVPKGKSILALAFNKHIAKELKEKTKIKSEISTFHSLGLKALQGKFGRLLVDINKCDNIIKKIIDYQFYSMIPVFKKSVSLCKMSLQDSPEQIYKLLEHHDVNFYPFSKEEFATLIIKILAKCKEDISCVDYDDMIWFPFVNNLYLGRYDYIYVDEAQDLNPAQLFMIKKLSSETNRTFLFYDDRQAIYGFRCADVDYLNNVVEKFNCKKLSLPISYRCPKSVVALAKKYVPDYQEFDGAIDGSIQEIDASNFIKYIKLNSVILSRFNYPLIDIYYKLLDNNISAKIKGKDIGDNLLSFITSMKAKSFNNLLSKIKKWETNQIDFLKKENKDYSNVFDKTSLIKNLMKRCSSVSELKTLITKLFVDVEEEDIVLLSTIHSFKGGERDDVFILKNTLMYSSLEEENIVYVAYTRTKKNLYLIEGNV